MDVLLLPTTGTIYTHEAVAADSGAAEYQPGLLHEFRQPAGPGGSGRAGRAARQRLPFGVSLIGPAFSDEALLRSRRPLPPRAGRVPGDALDLAACPPGCVAVAVVGAHLSGQPLNHELTDRGGRG